MPLKKGKKGESNKSMDGVLDYLMSLLASGLNGFDKTLADSQDILAQPVGDAWTQILGLSAILKPFCYVVIAICLLIELANVASKVDVVKWEHGLKIAVKLALSKVCIDIAPTFLQACYVQACDWITGIGKNEIKLGNKVLEQVEPLADQVDGFFTIFGLFASMLLVVLAIKICGILVQVMAYGRMFELYAYLAVSPLPCSFFPLGDGTGGGFSRITGKFFRSFASVCLQGVMMILCMKIFGIIMSTAFTEMIQDAVNSGAEASVIISDLSFTMLMAAIVLCLSLARCGQWAKNILDAV